MEKRFYHPRIKERVRAISSKSEAHRLLICSSLADGETEIWCNDTNADIDATVDCLRTLGADIERRERGFLIRPIERVSQGMTLDCKESGSTLRFLLPLSAALGANSSFIMRGRLSQRPLSPLYEILSENGIRLSPKGENPLVTSGRIHCGEYAVTGDVSSQYISGLLFALSAIDGKSTLEVCGKFESAPYAFMTVDALRTFGADIRYETNRGIFTVYGKGRLLSPMTVAVGGDWSNAAFFAVAGAIGDAIVLTGLDRGTHQGDAAILDILSHMGARIFYGNNGEITVYPSSLKGIEIDASQIPDLVPILSVAAAVADGDTRIYNAKRLRLKESDRIESVCSMLSSLGADVTETDDGMLIRGKKRLVGGKVSSFKDHRIAMSAAIASLACDGAVTIDGFEAISKSYPMFDKEFIYTEQDKK